MDKTETACCVTQCDKPLDQSYWEAQWQSKSTGWDIGHASPAICEYINQYSNKEAAILIPGCGNAYEAEYLVQQGFKYISVIDIAPKAVELLKEKFKNTPQVKVVWEDFFMHNGKYDLMIEQTFFCAISPSRRKEYVQKAHELLNENGKIAGLLFDKQFEKQGPPFGGCPCEYKPIFENDFEIKTMEQCTNSIESRKEQEVFIILNKKTQ